MYPEVTSVYVPVKTPDYKKLAFILSLLVHAAILGTVAYFHHEAPPEPMETSIVTPEQLSEIEGQIRANQQNNAAVSGDTAGAAQSTMSEIMEKVSNTVSPSQLTQPSTTQYSEPQDDQTQQVMNDIAAREAQWREEQAQFAEQIDREIAAENQQRIAQLNAEQAERQAQLNDFKQAEDNQDAIRQELIEAANKSQEALKAQREKSKPNVTSRNIDLKFDGEGSNTGNGSNQATSGGNGEPRKGASSGGNAASYKQAIISKIYSNWDVPSNVTGRQLSVRIRLSPSGDVISISVPGNDVYAQSLEQAINRSSPLPVPSDPALFQKQFANLALRFDAK